MTVCLIVAAVLTVTILCVVFIRNNEKQESDQLMLQLCEIGQRNLNYYFTETQKAVSGVTAFIGQDLDGLEDARLAAHVSRVRSFFEETARRTNGILTYYYRIDPEVSERVKGFWYTNLYGEGFTEHRPTDITEYDTSDESVLRWFTVPKARGESVWLPPYMTEGLDEVRVFSYNEPVFYRGRFIGVAGIEIDYATVAEEIDSLRLYRSGQSFLINGEGEICCHPRMDAMAEKSHPELLPEDLSGSTFFGYSADGVRKKAVWLPLENGMRLVVAVPVSETDGEWRRLVNEIVIASLAVLAVMILVSWYYAGRITRPLKELTQAAEEIERGNYDVAPEYSGNDELGVLTGTFRKMAENMGSHIADLSRRANTDALTAVRNKGAYTAAVEALQETIADDPGGAAFAIAAFDCNELKRVNDRFGHAKGDVYLKTACRLVCRVFKHSPVFRTGGDEFAAILQGQDFENRRDLIRLFHEEALKINDAAAHRWEEVHLAMGVAEYDSLLDRSAQDTAQRADRIMYQDKRRQKMKAQRPREAAKTPG